MSFIKRKNKVSFPIFALIVIIFLLIMLFGDCAQKPAVKEEKEVSVEKTNEFQKLKAEKKKIEAENDSLKKELNSLKEQNDELLSRNTRLGIENGNLESKIEDLKLKNGNTKSSLRYVKREMKEKIDGLNEEVNELRSDREVLVEELDWRETKTDQLFNKIAYKNQRIQKLESQKEKAERAREWFGLGFGAVLVIFFLFASDYLDLKFDVDKKNK